MRLIRKLKRKFREKEEEKINKKNEAIRSRSSSAMSAQRAIKMANLGKKLSKKVLPHINKYAIKIGRSLNED